jgi:hypothetical protein
MTNGSAVALPYQTNTPGLAFEFQDEKWLAFRVARARARDSSKSKRFEHDVESEFESEIQGITER